MSKTSNGRSGMTLTELMCCIAIIAILAAMYMGGLGKAYKRAKQAIGPPFSVEPPNQ
ncbi:MAG: prepilin-type N-terminal cleavage/methylation domain-containing protein [Verrucomicrobiia bacterium]|jgi:prepilin-type N-terminal cleavage/methylation domain-containing protein